MTRKIRVTFDDGSSVVLTIAADADAAPEARRQLNGEIVKVTNMPVTA